MPKLKVVEAQIIREVVGKADFLAQEIADFNRLASYVADIGEPQYLSTIMTLNRLIEQSAGMVRFYHQKMFLLQQEKEIRATLTARMKANVAEKPAEPVTDSPEQPRRARVRL